MGQGLNHQSLYKWACIALLGLGFVPRPIPADGINPQGATGGLVIPSAYVLPDRGLALGFGNYQEPKFGTNRYQRNLIFGLGILKNIEIFGRFADYNDAPHGEILWGGFRDLSANVKLQVPFLPERGPQLAVGLLDVGGAYSLFSTRYGVVTQKWWMLSASLGYAFHAENSIEEGYDGSFGGLEWRLDPTGLSLLAEYDGRASYAGARWQSPGLKAMGDLSVGASLQRSFGATFRDGKDADAVSYALNLYWPVGKLDAYRKDFVPSSRVKLKDLPVEESKPTESVGSEQLVPLRQALVAAGLERVRVGLRPDPSHPGSQELVVEYENHRYAQNEVDAIGVVMGLGSEMAPAAAQHMRAITLKDGLRIYETRVEVSSYRAFLREGPAEPVREGLMWSSGRSEASDSTHWEHVKPSGTTRLRLTLKPGLTYTVGTEVGAFDYSLAAKPILVLPLWTGARFTTEYSFPIDNSLNMEDGRAFSSLRHSEGLENVSIGQTFWVGRRILVHAAAGRFHFNAWGLQSELEAFVPGTSDVLRLKGAVYDQEPGGVQGGDRAGAVSYRHLWSPEHWTEVGIQRFSDGTSGPSLEWTRWSSEVGVTLFGRQGGQTRFAGLKLTVPLTPRKGMKPYFATVAGPAHYSQGLRTMIGAPVNEVQPSWVRDLVLETDLENEILNGGRISQAYLKSQIYRMREAYHLYIGDK